MVKSKYKLNKSLNKTEGKPSVILPNEFDGLLGFEEVSSYSLWRLNKYGRVKKSGVNKAKVTKVNKTKSSVTLHDVENDLTQISKKNNKSKKNKLNNNDSESAEPDDKKENKNKSSGTVSDEKENDLTTLSKENKKLKKKRKKNNTESTQPVVKKVCYDKAAYRGNCLRDDTAGKVDMTAWSDMFVPPLVLQALEHLGFSQPTEIQRLTLPAAIKGRKDIVGAAETGSGKTLAFGIPVIHGILKDIENEQDQPNNDSEVEGSDIEDEVKDDSDGENEEIAEPVSDQFKDAIDINLLNDDQFTFDGDNDDAVNTEESEGSINDSDEELLEDTEDGEQIGCVKVIKNVHFDFLDETIPETQDPRLKKPLRALIVTPTRELAIQVKSHLDAVLQYTCINTAVIVGGVASQKQERLLKRCPEIVIGTPGRLWELTQQGNPHLAQLAHIKYLVIDETDRMVEPGHFQELHDLLAIINSDEVTKDKRQTFVFSATLTMVHKAPKRFKTTNKNTKQPMTSQMKVENLVKSIGIKPKPKIVDVTKKFGTAESLTEARINCQKDEKDIYLFYFLNKHPGRTLVFCNSIDCVRRLQNLFTILQCKPQSLHASMHQKQRLKSLEKFSTSSKSLLLATDVAARGLDIPSIQHVIHYQVPRTAETYVHRSGRTARAYQEGLSILLIDPSEVTKYRQLCNTLNRSGDLAPFPIESEVMRQVKLRVDFAREVELMEHSMRKANAEENWIKKAAADAEILLDDDDDEEEYDGSKKHETAQKKQHLKSQRLALNKLLVKAIIPSHFSGKYPTHTGALIIPNALAISSYKNEDSIEDSETEITNSALSIMKKEKESFSKLIAKVKFKAPVNKVNKKKFKGFEKRKLKRLKEKEMVRKEMEKESNND